MTRLPVLQLLPLLGSKPLLPLLDGFLLAAADRFGCRERDVTGTVNGATVAAFGHVVGVPFSTRRETVPITSPQEPWSQDLLRFGADQDHARPAVMFGLVPARNVLPDVTRAVHVAGLHHA